MTVYRIANEKQMEDLSGYGAYLHGGRWSLKGVYALYTAATKSLALLEYMIRQFDRESWPVDLYLTTIEINETAKIHPLGRSELPANWQQLEYHIESQVICAEYFQYDLTGIRVPSVIVPGEANIILNPKHRQFSEFVRLVSIEPLDMDKRFRKTVA